jgi:protoheme IX farnesyltransferase
VIAFIDYVILYGWSKRHSRFGTLVGSISGAIPIVAGYLAVTNHFDAGAALLFLILVVWQMPHFYAIALYRLEDYKAANIPVWPAVKGIESTRIQIILYLILFAIVIPMLTIFGYTGIIYLVIMTIASLTWLWFGVQGFHKGVDVEKWARKLFFISLIELLLFCFLLSLSSFLV